MDSNIRRVLVLAGGGCRGYLEIKWLQKFLTQQNIQKPLHEIFDVIAGTSAGAINGLSIAYGKTLSEIEDIYRNKLNSVFSIAAVNQGQKATRPGTYDKISSILSNTPFYQSPSGVNEYGHNLLHQTLIDNFGNKTLQDLKTNVLVPTYDETLKEFAFFSNFRNDFLCYPDAKIVDTLRATSAAPVYLPSYKIGSSYFADGGIYNNFPASIAISLSKMIKPTAKKTRLLYLGTGKEKNWILNKGVAPDYPQSSLDRDSAVAYLMNLFNIASIGSLESEMLNLQLTSQYTLDDFACYGFDPVLTTPLSYTQTDGVVVSNYAPVDYELDNSDADFLDYMAALALKDFELNSAAISIFKARLFE